MHWRGCHTSDYSSCWHHWPPHEHRPYINCATKYATYHRPTRNYDYVQLR